MTAQHAEPDEPAVQVPARELRRLRALERIASPEELAEAADAARAEELDALEASALAAWRTRRRGGFSACLPGGATRDT